MSDSQKILEMIGSVDPEDTDTLDEIDARMDCWVKNNEYLKFGRINKQCCRDGHIRRSDNSLGATYIYSKEYTRSRDASMNIGPNAVEIWVRRVGGGRLFTPKHTLYGSMIITNWKEAICRTENLAYLHGKIQAIAYERANHDIKGSE